MSIYSSVKDFFGRMFGARYSAPEPGGVTYNLAYDPNPIVRNLAESQGVSSMHSFSRMDWLDRARAINHIRLSRQNSKKLQPIGRTEVRNGVEHIVEFFPMLPRTEVRNGVRYLVSPLVEEK